MSSEVQDIVRDATSDAGSELMTNIMEHDLPPILQDLVNEYIEFDEARNIFMWKWVHELAPQNTLPSIYPEYKEKVPTDKTITILFITLLDDLLEKQKDRETFEEASKIPFPYQTINWDRENIDTEYLKFVVKVWDVLINRLRQAPEYDRYDELFLYDIKQAINAIDYTSLAINRPELSTLQDLTLYESHNMVMFAYADTDLMHSPPETINELSTIREIVWHAQQMTRIGNWVSTWERELKEGDYSSGVIVYALRNNIIRESELSAIQSGQTQILDNVVSRIQQEGVEEIFLNQWDQRYENVLATGAELDSIDITEFADGLKEVLRYHLASKGLK